jgi:hypothetical protein
MAGACAGLIRGDTKAGAIKGSAATRTPLHDLAIIKCEKFKKKTPPKMFTVLIAWGVRSGAAK